MSDFTWPIAGGQGSGAARQLRGLRFAGGTAKGSSVPTTASRDRVATHHLVVDPSRSMKAITDQVETLLDSLDEGPRRSGALLASELVAQVIGRAPDSNGEPVGLTIQVRDDAVRLEATGPVAPSIEVTSDRGAVPPDPLADWGRFILDRLADRWGIGEGARRDIWAEIGIPA